MLSKLKNKQSLFFRKLKNKKLCSKTTILGVAGLITVSVLFGFYVYSTSFVLAKSKQYIVQGYFKSSGSPIAGAVVGPVYGEEVYTYTDSNGYYQINLTFPDYSSINEISLMARDQANIGYVDIIIDQSTPFIINKDIFASTTLGGAVSSGTITTVDGSPIEGAIVESINNRLDNTFPYRDGLYFDNWMHVSKTDKLGSYSPVLNYGMIRVSTPRYQSKIISGGDAILEMPSPGTCVFDFQGIILGGSMKEGVEIDAFTGTGRDKTYTSASGDYALYGVRYDGAGSWAVTKQGSECVLDMKDMYGNGFLQAWRAKWGDLSKSGFSGPAQCVSGKICIVNFEPLTLWRYVPPFTLKGQVIGDGLDFNQVGIYIGDGNYHKVISVNSTGEYEFSNVPSMATQDTPTIYFSLYRRASPPPSFNPLNYEVDYCVVECITACSMAGPITMPVGDCLPLNFMPVGPGGEMRVDFYIKSPNTPPSCPTTYTPISGSTNQPLDQDISWSGASDPESDPLTYDVYFGTTSPGTFIQNQTAETYNPGALIANTKYYWKVKVKDGTNTTDCAVQNFTTAETVSGAYWRFTTKAEECVCVWADVAGTCGDEACGDKVCQSDEICQVQICVPDTCPGDGDNRCQESLLCTLKPIIPKFWREILPKFN